MRFFNDGSFPAPTFFKDSDLELIKASSFVGDNIDFEFGHFSGFQISRQRRKHRQARFRIAIKIDPTGMQDDTVLR